MIQQASNQTNHGIMDLDTIEGLGFATGDGVGESESYETIGS